MPKPSPEILWNLNDKELLSLLEKGAFAPVHQQVYFYAPSFMYYKTRHYYSSPNSFPSISVTGNSCALNCKHCGGKVLKTMHAAPSPEALFDLATQLKKNGAVGCLISGGCLPDGSVPLDRFMLAIRRIKRELGLTIFVHTGIVNLETAVALKQAGVDTALIDVIGSSETVNKIYNLKVSIQDYADSLKALEQSHLSFVPHLIVGLNEGKLDGELEALKMISQVKPSALVIIAFMPIHGTKMAKTQPSTPVDIAKVAAVARQMFPQTPLVLGCMRPKGAVRNQTDVLALKAGVDAIAFASEEAIKYAQDRGYKTSFSSYCCAQIYGDLKNQKI